MSEVYTFGYAGKKITSLLSWVRTNQATLVDIRYAPHSRMREWNIDILRKELGSRYVILTALGNVNYRGGDIKLRDIEHGIGVVGKLLSQGPVVLMCGCANYQTCHRKAVADLLGERGITSEELALDGAIPASVSQEEIAVITLYQPFASLWASPLDVKVFHSMTWGTEYRGPLAIHASRLLEKGQIEIMRSGHYPQALSMWDINTLKDVPRSQIIAVTEILGCFQVEGPEDPALLGSPFPWEREFGDYHAGRWAWKRGPVRALVPPIEMRGTEGCLWSVDRQIVLERACTEAGTEQEVKDRQRAGAEALASLPPVDQKRIVKAVAGEYPSEPDEVLVRLAREQAIRERTAREAK